MSKRAKIKSQQVSSMLLSLAEWHREAGQPDAEGALRAIAEVFEASPHQDLSTILGKLAEPKSRIM